jgi:stage III sporulation protein AA
MIKDNRFLQAAGALSDRITYILSRIPLDTQEKISEVRLRIGGPLSVVCGTRSLFVEERGGVSGHPTSGSVMIDRRDMQDCFIGLCGFAVHSHQKELTSGYISIKGGHRAGICATAVVENDRLSTVRDITSINLRIAREIRGAADGLVAGCFSDKPTGVLLAGAPSSGKTTILRDLSRQLAGGANGNYFKVCVVDESSEIGGACAGVIQNDLGITSDLLSGYPKDRGLQIAVRYLSPQIIICDEIANQSEIEAVAAAANCGVAVVTSVHAGSIEELLLRPQTKPLLASGAFEYVVQLQGAQSPCCIQEIKQVREL